jgi:hypothetical protein
VTSPRKRGGSAGAAGVALAFTGGGVAVAEPVVRAPSSAIQRSASARFSSAGAAST